MMRVREDHPFQPDLHPDYHKQLGLAGETLQGFLYLESLYKINPCSILSEMLRRIDKHYFSDMGGMEVCITTLPQPTITN